LLVAFYLKLNLTPLFLSSSFLLQAYPAFAQWQRNPENQASWSESLDYWKQQLKAAQLHLSLPVIAAAAVATLGDAGPAKTVEFDMRPEIVGAMNAIAAKVS
jgi:hypothetical protein